MALEKWQIHSIEQVVSPKTALDETNPTISALTNVSMPVNANVRKTVPSGEVFAATGSIDFSTVDLSFRTTQLSQILAILGVSGDCINANTQYNVYVAKMDCGAPAAGEVHRRYTFQSGVFHLQNLQADHRGDASVSAIIKATVTGGAPVVTITEDVALPNATQIGDQSAVWTLHDETKTTVNGTGVEGKQSVNIDFGVTTSSIGADSNPYDERAYIDSILPVVQIRGIDPLWVDDADVGLTLTGAAVTHANTSIALRKRNGAGGFIADATAEHILITANGPAHYPNLFSGDANQAGGATIQIDGIKSATNQAPLIITVDTAV